MVAVIGPAAEGADMLTAAITVKLKSPSKTATREYNDAAADPAGWFHDADTDVLFEEETANDVGGIRAVNAGDE